MLAGIGVQLVQNTPHHPAEAFVRYLLCPRFLDLGQGVVVPGQPLAVGQVAGADVVAGGREAPGPRSQGQAGLEVSYCADGVQLGEQQPGARGDVDPGPGVAADCEESPGCGLSVVTARVKLGELLVARLLGQPSRVPTLIKRVMGPARGARFRPVYSPGR